MINIDNANSISGWMSPEELKWLAKQAKKHLNIVEVGSYLGRSTRALADNTNGVVFAIDDFQGPRDAVSVNDVLDIFLTNLTDLIQQEKVIPVLADHKVVKVSFIPDMVFIDGSHEYKDVKTDIEKWLSKLAHKGLICGHDYTNIEDVEKAVKELIPEARVAKKTSIWYYEKP